MRDDTEQTNHASRALVVVVSHDLDGDGTSSTDREANAPASDSGQRAELKRVVAEVHPDARLRSFAHGAATFVDSHHLIVAHYVDAPRSKRSSRFDADGTAPQEALFGA